MRHAERPPGGRLAIIMALIERHAPDARRSWRLDRPRDPTSTLCRPLANAQYKAYYDERSFSAVSTKYWTPAGLVKLFIDEWGLRASHSRNIRLPVGETWHSAQSGHVFRWWRDRPARKWLSR
jgi:hypothetical protein